MRTVYVVGVPGSGKTTLVNAALKLLDLRPVTEAIAPIPHVRHGTLWHLGRHRDPFGGTDTLAMNIQPKAIRWVLSLGINEHVLDPADVAEHVPSVLLGEGDRLANPAFFEACPNLTVVHLDTPYVEARNRASIRARATGNKPQDESWWKGRVTKVNNLVNSRRTLRLDGTQPVAENATVLAELLCGEACQ